MNDLGPLAWVLDELRKSLEGAAKALKRFVREAEAARGSDLAALDASHLRIARQQLHQAVGALEMVGLTAPALVLRAMETAVQKFIQQPEQCNQEAAGVIERASFALAEYLEGVLADKPLSAVSLFPQFRQVQELVRADRIHPADLWSYEWRWLEPELASRVEPLNYDHNARAVLDQSVLQIMKGKAPESARVLMDLSLGLSARQAELRPRVFWKIAAAYFEALLHDMLPADIYVRRAASRILLQYASLSKGDSAISDRLAQDLLFFCAQAFSSDVESTPVLSAVRMAFGLNRFKPVDYEAVQFGRYDPALLVQVRKRIVNAKETWSSLSAGEATKFKLVVDQFSLVSDSLVKLHPASEPLAQALSRMTDMTARSGQAPAIGLAMEVATSVLYLEAAFDDLDPDDPQLAKRTRHLAERLENVLSGGQPQPLESWMEDLYRQVSDKQTMGSVVGELRVSLGEIEKSLDQFFRLPREKGVLRDVPSQLSQMRGVLSVLGLEQAAHAVLHMRGVVEKLMLPDMDASGAPAAETFDQLGNNLGALSFLIDMLNYQPALAKKLFVYDETKGELRPLMGRTQRPADAPASSAPATRDLIAEEVNAVVLDAGNGASNVKLTDKLEALATHAALAGQTALAETARNASTAVSQHDAAQVASAFSTLADSVTPPATSPVAQPEPVHFEEDDLRDIFIEEAREAAGNGQEAVVMLASDPGDVGQLTVLRRVFHTFKGSSRMVGLNEFGEAAWAMEQLFNSWLAEQKAATDDFRALAADALRGFSKWIEDIAAHRDNAWTASAFRASAEAMQNGGTPVALSLPSTSPVPVPVIDESMAEPVPLHDQLAGVSEEAEVAFDALPPADDAIVVTATDEPADFAFFFDEELPELPATPAVLDAPEAQAQPLDITTSAEVEALYEISGIDLESLSALSSVDERVAVVPAAPAAESLEIEDLALDFPEALQSAESAEMLELTQADFDEHFMAEPAATLETGLNHADLEEDMSSPLSEQVKVIGTLRIGIPLYNVYLNEADEWSRRLVTEMSEWAMELDQPVGDSTVALAHSLAGSSATVGFEALSGIARALEHALQQSQAHHNRDTAPTYASLFVDAAEDIRRLLHQFAAGFMKEPDAALLDRLRRLEFVEPSSTVTAEDSGFEVEAPEPVDTTTASSMAFAPLVAVAAAALPVVERAATPVSTFTAVPEDITAESLARDDNDEIDAVDAIDPELFPIFDEEAAELMPQLGGALRQWSARPDNQSARMEVLRALHTLKGSARLAGALRLGEMAHRIESEIEYMGAETAAALDFDPLLTRFDAMEQTLDALRKADTATASTPLEALQAIPEPATLPEISLPAAVDASVYAPVHETAAVSGKLMVPAPQTMAMQPLRQAASASIRVRSQLLDRMVNQAGEVMITRSRLEVELGQLRGSLADMSGNLNRLRQQLRDIELQAETQMQSRLAQAKELQAGFDPLEFDRFTRVQELTRMMAESVNDVATVQRTLQRTVEATEDDLIAQARQTRELQRDLLRTRMVEFEGISDRLYRVVRLASKETGKQVRLDLLGGTIEMDRGLLDRMTPAFEHLLRNCVAHGIENPAARAAAGKDPIGLITVHLRQDGNDVSVEFSDDGAGLDLARIRDKAQSLGLLAAGQSLSDQEAANLIFTPGFSTAAQVTELAGRGIGMDVVRSEVNSVGGRIETSTTAGRGTQFKLVLPLTTAVTQVVMVRTGNLSVGVPANVVETVRRISARELQQAYNTGVLDVGGEAVPFFWSGALLQASQRSVETQTKTTPVVVFRSAAQRLALHVDEVLGNQEVVVKNLGPQLSRLPGLAGMSVLASGAVVLIYNPVALASMYGQQARAMSGDSAEPHMLEAPASNVSGVSALPPAVLQIPLILVVDDSITVRRVTQRLLQREGYRVALAADGLQALERLQEERPAVVLSDIEMPRMDGFDLARNIRADARLSGLPIIMITSRIAEKHRDHARELGVDHYLGKPYSEEELMRLVRNYCQAEAVASA